MAALPYQLVSHIIATVLKAFWLVLTGKNVKWKERSERDRSIPYSNVDLQTKLCVPNLALRRRRIRDGSSGASESTKKFCRPQWTTSLSYWTLKTCADCVYLSKNRNRRSSGHKIPLLLYHSLLKYRHAYHFRFVLFLSHVQWSTRSILRRRIIT